MSTTITGKQRLETAKWIVNAEARRDTAGHIKLYKLPVADGGGKWEYAGINDRYHPQILTSIRAALATGSHATAERIATDHIASYTDIVDRWTVVPSINAFLRDCCFNRGPKGALRILQLAVGVADDGKWGPKTSAQVRSREQFPSRLLEALRGAREQYERRVAPPVGARAAFWQGLVRRWNNAHDYANSLIV